MAAGDVVHAAVGDDHHGACGRGVHVLGGRLGAPVAVALVDVVEHDGRGHLAGDVESVEHERDLGALVSGGVLAQVDPHLAGGDGAAEAVGAGLRDVQHGDGRGVFGAVALVVASLAVGVARVVLVTVLVVHHVVCGVERGRLVGAHGGAVCGDALVGEDHGHLVGGGLLPAGRGLGAPSRACPGEAGGHDGAAQAQKGAAAGHAGCARKGVLGAGCVHVMPPIKRMRRLAGEAVPQVRRFACALRRVVRRPPRRLLFPGAPLGALNAPCALPVMGLPRLRLAAAKLSVLSGCCRRFQERGWVWAAGCRVRRLRVALVCICRVARCPAVCAIRDLRLHAVLAGTRFARYPPCPLPAPVRPLVPVRPARRDGHRGHCARPARAVRRLC